MHAMNGINAVPTIHEQEVPQANDERTAESWINIGVIYGKNIEALKNEIAAQQSQKKILNDDITRLKSSHITELNSVMNRCEFARNFVVEKVKWIVQKLTTFSEKNKNCGCIPFDTIQFQTIIGTLSSFNYFGRIYPQYTDKRTEIISKTDQDIKPFPILFDHSSVFSQELMGLEKQVNFIKDENRTLIDKKDLMIDFHKHYLKDLSKNEEQIKEAVQKVREIYNNMIWEVTLNSDENCINCAYTHSLISPENRRIYHNQLQMMNNVKLKELQENILGDVLKLGDFAFLVN